MGARDILTSEMRKCYKGCDFVRLDYFGSSKGLISGFNEFLTLDYSTALQSALLIFIHNQKLDMDFSILNIYGPYVGKEFFWD